MRAFVSGTAAPRLPPFVPPQLDEAQKTLFENIVSTRINIVGYDALFDEAGGLRGPWNAEVASPGLGQHLERLATAVRANNSLEPRVYEVAILAVGVHARAQFEWYAHERIARKAGVADVALCLIKAAAPAAEISGALQEDELAAYKVCGSMHGAGPLIRHISILNMWSNHPEPLFDSWRASCWRPTAFLARRSRRQSRL